jgi:hypothetical protein
MDKTLVIFSILVLVFVAVTAGMVVMSAPGNLAIHNGTVGSDYEALAKQFVMDDPTFEFDGMPETLNVNIGEACEPVIATVDFTSRQAGYGDRTGMMLAQVLTPHRCVIEISGGQVVSAVMDDAWDMISQKELDK